MDEARGVLLDGPGGPREEQFVAVGDTIDTHGMDGFLRGHGTQIVKVDEEEVLMATVCGVVERVNKLVSVRPLKSRYSADLGDVVVGRIIEIVGKRWKVDINARQQAQLQLSAVNLPGGAQRRRTAEDELNMRAIFREGDLITAEVQAFQVDGSVALHTRSAKYGRLSGGTLVKVSPNLIKRQKHHFLALDKTVQWPDLGAPSTSFVGAEGDVGVAPQPGGASKAAGPVPFETREAVSRVTNSITCLSSLSLAVHPTAILDVLKLSQELQLQVKDVIDPAFAVRVAEMEVKRRADEDQR
eukprot:CAMPEP_0117649254 /NCGR_PEP_ID=MMETSP0804-20121206/868_1 /TAXON_ID=1074897 /ORGANISM="Tetraselmis astigmatica, Strain CCMP880" /LENGTH=298 /DNA_ID=CAMNT_0005454967 /DNA_START=115 /DNA_END=1012 /DNA_ORIENTATION=+